MIARRACLAGQLARTLGPRWVVYRIGHQIRRQSGALRRRLPAVPWDEVPLAAALTDASLADPAAYLTYRRETAPPFFFRPEDRHEAAPLLRAWDAETGGPLPEVDDLERGMLRYFAHKRSEVGFPPDWHRNPFTGERAPADRHWSEIDDFGFGDIKVIWEPNRFGFAFALVRAYWRTGDNRYAELFWQMVEDWHAANPPHLGPNWKCGQETSLRVMAWCFGLYGLLDTPSTTADRVSLLTQMIALSGRRIEATLDYALSQRNNHGVSEGMGLWTIGTLFPELDAASRWRALGKGVLERLSRELIYEDGAFSQHSTNYHRFMLHDYLWSLRLGDVTGQPFSAGVVDRVGRAADLLYQLQDQATGRVPCYGANDGSLVLPLSTCDYRDYRPVVQAARYLTTHARTYGDGPWDEDLFWLFGAGTCRAAVAPPPRSDLQAEVSGYYTLRSATGFAFTRCPHRYRDRPSHADALHVDLWWRGINIALDPGTYSYNAPAPWGGALAHTAYHNTVTVDGRSQMDQIGRFLWFPWLTGRHRISAASPKGQIAYWEGEHDGYRRLPAPVDHRRAIVRLGDEHWLVLDDLRSAQPHDYRLHWLLPDLPYESGVSAIGPSGGQIALTTPVGDYRIDIGGAPSPGSLSTERASVEGPRGWSSPRYFERAPALSLATDVRGDLVRFWSIFGPAGYLLSGDPSALVLEWDIGRAELVLGQGAHDPLAVAIRLSGSIDDRLELTP